ncbi:MAG TPA: lysophospholipid acyltransferase family protein [Anaeromyxobacteraceae bacterium]|nr:lysophospholipid acyltransferase family protein [Anaeromyxobacteraceae bacterium]
MDRVRGIAVAVYAALSMAFFFFLSLPVMIVTGSGELPIWLARKAWSRSCLWLAGVRIEQGRSRPLPPGPAIYASNHESALDIWALFRVLPAGVRFVAKEELFRIPVFGWYLRLGGHVPVDRHRRARAVSSLHRAAEAVRSGTSLIVFPEGTRSLDGRIHPFKKGPFALAMEAGVPVVPIAISGSGRITPKKVLSVRPGKIRMAVGEPFDPGQAADRTDLLRTVRRRIIELHREIGGLGGDEEETAAPPGGEGASRPPPDAPPEAGAARV